ncbi:Metallo-hydrolase/oxidoreductase [Basidiobolus meristosporus CBS 931.73]|uniref:Metallo-hydrolase/oxidoreductase n=1 Tax=Basidiobolus meristosporus CBS 931.73 TaxID=1314790 RepID=A0A1Y1X652_9FUNG|nr:Metallo-hydrolase/oxidoreductase [Basidiobolus meristosporus CBS 931.73]|eukprot:ORX81145.1 Metallo-hydrolase/oxidoreductase [Basidiobolus meristosporus CBS 931.73]
MGIRIRHWRRRTDACNKPSPLDSNLYRIANRAHNYLSKALYKAAANEYTKALTQLAPDYAGADSEVSEFVSLLLTSRSASYCKLEQYDQALNDAIIATHLKPQWSKGYFCMAEALLAKGQFSEAIKHYDKAAEYDAGNIEIRVGKAKAKLMHEEDVEGFITIQLLAGRDIANTASYNPIQNKIFEYAAEMRNFIYLIVDKETRECVVVDACWDATGIMNTIEKLKLKLVGAVVTHYHFDHVGGYPPPPFDQLPIRVSGLATILKRWPHVKAYIHIEDIKYLRESNPGVEIEKIIPTCHNYSLKLGKKTTLTFLHTPGHTPGSQCIYVNECRLFSGDTLFLGHCGRTDLPGGCKHAMYDTLHGILGQLPNDVVVYPGHNYGGAWTTIGQEKWYGILRDTSREKFESR